jgi:heterodisulfide reductase subunit A
VIARVEPALCISAQGRKCGLCALACPYGAIDVEVGRAALVTPAKCHGCGACVAECPHNAISQDHFTDAQIVAQMRELLRDDPEDKILALMCHWCSYGGADNAGTSHFQYPADSRGIRVMCSARMDQDLILEAFRRGAGMVLVSGCHPQDCHYISGQQVAARRFDRMFQALQRLGINPERFRVEWISAAEGDKYARVITEMSEKLGTFDKAALRAENEAARDAIARRLLRWKSLPDMVALMAEEEVVPA